MYEDQIIDTVHDENSNLYLSREGREMLHKTGNWALFFAVLGFIGLAFYVLFALVFMGMGAFFPTDGMPTNSADQLQYLFPAMGFFMLVVVVLYGVPVFKLYKFATQAKTAARSENSEILTSAIKNLHGHYKWIGIIFLVSVALYFVGVFVMMGIMGSVYNGF